MELIAIIAAVIAAAGAAAAYSGGRERKTAPVRVAPDRDRRPRR